MEGRQSREKRTELAGKMEGLLRVNMGLSPGERLAVITDRVPAESSGSPEGGVWRARNDGAALLARTASSLGGKAEFIIFTPAGGHGQEPPRDVWEGVLGRSAVSRLDEEGLLGPLMEKSIPPEDLPRAGEIVSAHRLDAVDAVVAMTGFSTSHTRLRGLFTGFGGGRYASMPRFEMDMFFGPMDVDYGRMNRRTRRLARLLNRAVAARVTAPGTDLAFSLAGRTALADTGLLTRPGAFGNLPAGEAYIAPVEGTAEGRLTLQDPSGRPDELTFLLRGGRVARIEGAPGKVRVWEERLSAHPGNANLAELGIGTNDRARRPDIVLEAEKIIGTVHLALGDNRSMGGESAAPFHVDFVLWGPSLELTLPDGSTRRVMVRRLGAGADRRSRKK